MFSRFGSALLGLMAGLLISSGASAGVSILSDGADGTSAKIRIQSAIKRGDLAAFEAAVDLVSQTAKTRINDVPFITVELDSPGGDVVEAVGIGRVIYRHSAMTLVRPGQECVSACVFILIAGAVRTPTDSASIGLHRPLLVSWRNMDYAEARAKYDGLMRYLHDYFLELGVSEAAYDTMMRTDSFGMRYFSPGELDQLRLRGESPEWRARYAPQRIASGRPMTSRGQSLVDAPELPKIDESYRYVVFMPGAQLAGDSYFAGMHIPNLHFVWDSLDEGRQTLDWSPPDFVGALKRVFRAVSDVVGPNWWLLGLFLFELIRGQYAVWPGDTADRRLRRRDQWRLAPFRPYPINPVSARESGQA